MCCYHHFTLEERESLLILRIRGESIRSMAKELSRSPSSISRELRRNSYSHEKCGYSPIRAQRRYCRVRKKCRRNCKLQQEAVRATVGKLLEMYWSPEQISHRLKREKHKVQISFSTIYRGFENGLLERKSLQYLRLKSNIHKSRKRKSNCGCIPVLYSIHERPKKVNQRQEIGHWESDTVVGSRSRQGIATHVERKSRYTVLLKVSKVNHTDTYMEATKRAFETLPERMRRSFTVDHGKEFAGYKRLMDELGCLVYFADPYCPNQRGTNENTNGLLRQFVPKGLDVSNMSQLDLDAIAYRMNTRPRKCLGWLSPHEVFFKNVLHFT